MAVVVKLIISVMIRPYDQALNGQTGMEEMAPSCSSVDSRKKESETFYNFNPKTFVSCVSG